MRLTSNPQYIQSSSKFPIAQFHDIMQQLFVKRLDYNFLTMFYQDYSKTFMNAQTFYQDAMQCKHRQMSVGDIGPAPTNNNGRVQINTGPLVDENAARAALNVIA